MHAGGAPSRLTAPVAGWYTISGVAEFAANLTGARSLRILLNGAGSGIARVYFSEVPQVNDVFDLNISTEYYLAVNDFVELQVFQASTGSLNVQGSGLAPFSAVLISQ
jgi:hypothetical protein